MKILLTKITDWYSFNGNYYRILKFIHLFLSRDKMKPNDELNKEGTNSISNNENATNNPTQEDTTLEQNDIISGNGIVLMVRMILLTLIPMRIQITTV